MKRILTFLALSLAAYVSFSQSPIYGRLRVISGLYDNYFQNGTDTFKLGWRTDRFQLKYNTNKRFIDLIKSDSTVKIYNKLILESPNDTMLSVRGMFNATSDSYINSLRIGKGVSNIATNTAFGVTALNSITTGNENTGIGYHAMMTTTTGGGNTAIGAYSFIVNTTGQFNTAVGTGTLNSNISGNNNVAIGRTALYKNSTGDFNVAIGVNSLNLNTTGHYNTAIGALALWKVTGSANIGVGMGAIQNMTSGDYNIAIGQYTGYGFNSGANNILIGFQAGRGLTTNPTNNIFIGHNSGNVGGQKVDVTGSMAIGYESYADKDLQYVYGNTSVVEHNFRSGSLLFTGTTGATPASGAGTRLMWIPSKAAFRAGAVDGTQWDDSLVGHHSTALGQETTASGVASTALGEKTTASGQVSFAMGYRTFASGAASTALGEKTTASGWASTALGKVTTASGDYSFASGVETVANSLNLSVFGQYNDTTISNSKINWVSSDPLFQIGNGTDDESNRNDAFRILKNGTTYIADASSTTDAILKVDPTDSTSAFIGNVSITDTTFMEHLTVTDSVTLEDALFDIYHLAPDSDSLLVADDGIINLPTGAYGELRVWVFNSGMYAEYAVVILNVDGSIGILVQNSANVTTTGGTDGNLNIYDAGAYTTIENKLGGSRTIKYVFTH